MSDDYARVWDDHPEYTMFRDGLECLEMELGKQEPALDMLDVGLDMLAVAAVAFDLADQTSGPIDLWEAREMWEGECVWSNVKCPRCGEILYDNLTFVAETDFEFIECSTCGWGYVPGMMFSRQFMEHVLGASPQVDTLQPGWVLLSWRCGCEAIVTPADMGAHWVCGVHGGDVMVRVAQDWLASRCHKYTGVDQLVRQFEAEFGPQRYAAWLVTMAQQTHDFNFEMEFLRD